MKKKDKYNLHNDKIDILTSTLKSALGSAPVVGSVLAEFVSIIIPNQRIDRIIKFAETLEKRLHNLEDEIKSKLSDEQFTDLLEEAIRQAMFSLSDEREYISSLIIIGLKKEDIEYSESKHLLRILSEISDIEVIILRYYLVPTLGGDQEFRKKHKDILRILPTPLSYPPTEHEKDTMYKSHQEHLVSLGLLDRVKGYHITKLGVFLLRQIGLMGFCRNQHEFMSFQKIK